MLQTFVLLENEGWLLNKKMQLIPKLYYVAAVDKTPRPDTGLPDEGMMAAAPPPPRSRTFVFFLRAGVVTWVSLGSHLDFSAT